jgi:uncharacterized protein YbjQ (UPF0145 family)
MSTRREAFMSTHLTASSLRALTAVGFRPVGVVLGNSTTHIARPIGVGLDSRLSTLVRGFRGDRGELVPQEIQRMQSDGGGATPRRDPPYLVGYPCPHFANRPSVAGGKWADHFPGYNWELPQPGQAFMDCFGRALDRLTDQAAQFGAHGVVDIRVDISGSAMLQGNVGISLSGSAIIDPSSPPLEKPFTAGISCQAFAKLLTTGLIPVQFTMGATLLSSWIGCQSRNELESGYAKSVVQLGDALTQARDSATARMWQQTDVADAPFVAVTLHHAHTRASKTDYRSCAWSTGTVVQRFAPALAESGDLVAAAVQMARR